MALIGKDNHVSQKLLHGWLCWRTRSTLKEEVLFLTNWLVDRMAEMEPGASFSNVTRQVDISSVRNRVQAESSQNPHKTCNDRTLPHPCTQVPWSSRPRHRTRAMSRFHAYLFRYMSASGTPQHSLPGQVPSIQKWRWEGHLLRC